MKQYKPVRKNLLIKPSLFNVSGLPNQIEVLKESGSVITLHCFGSALDPSIRNTDPGQKKYV